MKPVDNNDCQLRFFLLFSFSNNGITISARGISAVGRQAEMDINQFFEAQLNSTLEGFTWAAHQVPGDRLRVIPPGDLGEWTATQHIFHLLHYEQKLALPSMQQWLGGSAPVRDEVNV